ncbi:hypothetical protein F8388_024881 [Cannabis sativa]|uniref:Reverse transcriptase zinc-binding domain-containing protein n=1 Tax=Cannabis sativa TaxID=3483 RepID=A0A7J6H9B6_CANSA|nr:hypothetical protein F8388_024881 [Cannabis sativa]
MHPLPTTLIWRILTGCLPLKNCLRFLQGNERLCGLCEEEVETDIHLYHDCPFARCLWFPSPWGIFSSSLSNLSFENLFLWLSNAKNDSVLLYVACIFEQIWKCRNNLLFLGAFPDLQSSIRTIKHRASEFGAVLIDNY